LNIYRELINIFYFAPNNDIVKLIHNSPCSLLYTVIPVNQSAKLSALSMSIVLSNSQVMSFNRISQFLRNQGPFFLASHRCDNSIPWRKFAETADYLQSVQSMAASVRRRRLGHMSRSYITYIHIYTRIIHTPWPK